jgi:peptidoglycan/LPS O-acetylase OafA/YrhL
MRAIAVMCVLVVHAAGAARLVNGSLGGSLLAHLNIGVAIFFLISGFLLYRPFIASRSSTAAPPRIGDYVKRRLLRIYPAYWLVLITLLVLKGRSAVGGANLWSMFSLTQNLPIYNGPGCSLNSCDFSQTWSLGAELSFYVTLPLLVVVVERLTRGFELRRWVAAQVALLGSLSAISIALEFGVFYPDPDWVAWTVTGTFFWFALGMGMAVASVAALQWGSAQRLRQWLGAHGPLLWAAATASYVGLCLIVSSDTFVQPAWQALVTHVAYGLVGLLLLAPVIFSDGRRRVPQRVLTVPAVAWLGLISYGVFLWHAPVLLAIVRHWGRGSILVLLPATLAASVPIAALSYYVLERPLMKLKYRPLIVRRPGSA